MLRARFEEMRVVRNSLGRIRMSARCDARASFTVTMSRLVRLGIVRTLAFVYFRDFADRHWK